MKKILIILLLMIATVLPTFATNWVQVGNKYYIDIDTIEPYVDDFGHVAPNQYSYWTKVLNDGSDFYKRQEKKINKKIWYEKSREIIDLNRKSVTTKCIIVYDIKQNVILNFERSDFALEWLSIVPDSVSDYILHIVKSVINEE